MDGNVTLFRVALAILSCRSAQLLSTKTAGAFYDQLHTLAAHMLDADELIRESIALRRTIRASDVSARRARFVNGASIRDLL